MTANKMKPPTGQGEGFLPDWSPADCRGDVATVQQLWLSWLEHLRADVPASAALLEQRAQLIEVHPERVVVAVDLDWRPLVLRAVSRLEAVAGLTVVLAPSASPQEGPVDAIPAATEQAAAVVAEDFFEQLDLADGATARSLAADLTKPAQPPAKPVRRRRKGVEK